MGQEVASEMAKVDVMAWKLESKESWLLEGTLTRELSSLYSITVLPSPRNDGLNYFDS